MDYFNAQVVPVEKLNLRMRWVEFRTQPRNATSEPSPDIVNLGFMSEEEAENAGV
jgi:hypothetical protein